MIVEIHIANNATSSRLQARATIFSPPHFPDLEPVWLASGTEAFRTYTEPLVGGPRPTPLRHRDAYGRHPRGHSSTKDQQMTANKSRIPSMSKTDFRCIGHKYQPSHKGARHPQLVSRSMGSEHHNHVAFPSPTNLKSKTASCFM